MKKTLISLISLAFIGLTACNTTPNTSNPSSSASPSVTPSGEPGTGILVTKQQYLNFIECLYSKVPDTSMRQLFDMVKTSVNAIPDASWNASATKSFSSNIDAWKTAYSHLGCSL